MLNFRLISEKRTILFFLILIVNIIYCAELNAQIGKKLTTVVLDPGHGGRDPGAIGKKCKEKDIALKIALKTGDYIKKNCPDVKVVYTRSTDVFVELEKRAKIAHENKADLFISIHCNAASSSAYGVETFVMGKHKNEANLEVAKKENASIMYEDDAESVYDGFDPNSPESYIMLNFFQNEFINSSLRFAECVQHQLVNRVGRKDRGVQQAGFLVLYKTAMPSVLVEVGFVSNPSEEKFLISEDGQTYIASALFRAFRDYKKEYEADNAIEGDVYEKIDTPQIIDAGKLVYKVQIETSSKKLANVSQRFKDLENVDYYEHNGQYKYTAGVFNTKKEANDYCKKVKAKGYKNAFVVSFKDGVRQ